MQEWNDFEVAHGNEDTFREMLRVKRSVSAQFSSVNVATQELLAQAEKLKQQEKELKERAAAAIAATEAEAAARKRARPANWDPEGGALLNADEPSSREAAADDADVDDEDDVVEQKALPTGLFGAGGEDEQPVSGALNLFKRHKPASE